MKNQTFVVNVVNTNSKDTSFPYTTYGTGTDKVCMAGIGTKAGKWWILQSRSKSIVTKKEKQGTAESAGKRWGAKGLIGGGVPFFWLELSYVILLSWKYMIQVITCIIFTMNTNDGLTSLFLVSFYSFEVYIYIYLFCLNQIYFDSQIYLSNSVVI